MTGLGVPGAAQLCGAVFKGTSWVRLVWNDAPKTGAPLPWRQAESRRREDSEETLKPFPVPKRGL